MKGKDMEKSERGAMIRPPNAVDIVADFLAEKGYDELCNDYGCGCKLDDLAPCGAMCENCEAAFLFECAGDDGEKAWLMSPDPGFCSPESPGAVSGAWGGADTI